MSTSPAQWVTLQIRCALPVEVAVGDDVWRISLCYYSKGHRAEIVAQSRSGKIGVLADGRSRSVESDLRRGISVPVGSMRHRIALALAARGLASLLVSEDDDLL